MDALLREMAVLAKQLMAQDFGFPAGVHEIRPPSASGARTLPSEVQELYSLCDGIDLPDVHNGYFISDSAWLLSAKDRGQPTECAGVGKILVFGSDGGGGLLAVTPEGGVFYLPEDGAVRDGTYHPSSRRPPVQIASSLLDFIRRLVADVKAFVEDRQGHRYMTDSANLRALAS